MPTGRKNEGGGVAKHLKMTMAGALMDMSSK